MTLIDSPGRIAAQKKLIDSPGRLRVVNACSMSMTSPHVATGWQLAAVQQLRKALAPQNDLEDGRVISEKGAILDV
jgi:hypothetical protein